MKTKFFFLILTLLLSLGISSAFANQELMSLDSDYSQLDTQNDDEMKPDPRWGNRRMVRCAAGLRVLRNRNFVSIFWGQTWGRSNHRWAQQRACRMALGKCQQVNRMRFFGRGQCMILRNWH